jgi:hypothetical protein
MRQAGRNAPLTIAVLHHSRPTDTFPDRGRARFARLHFQGPTRCAIYRLIGSVGPRARRLPPSPSPFSSPSPAPPSLSSSAPDARQILRVEPAFAGRMRRFLPRKTDLQDLPRDQILNLVQAYNHTPRQCLDIQTPAEVFSQLLHFEWESTLAVVCALSRPPRFRMMDEKFDPRCRVGRGTCRKLTQ